jgi:hypothetical protein
VIHHNCNNVHYIAFEGALPTTQISLIDNVHILRFIGAWCVSDVSSFNNTVELSLLFSAPILREIGERDIQKVRSLFIEGTPHVTRLPPLPSLERLQLKHLENLEEIDVLGCPNLKEVSLSEVLYLTSITPFRNTHKLWLHDLPQVTDISMLTIVRDLALYNMSNVNQGWSSLQENCERLIIDTHNSLTSFSGCAFKKLRYLELKSCERFTGVEEVNQVEENCILQTVG